MFFQVGRKKLKSIYDLSNLDLSFDLTEARKKYKILVIDDEGFGQEDNLKSLGYKDIQVEYSYKNMESYEPYDIIFCDINGVAKGIDETFQGAALAKNIKTAYPDKIVILFSAMEFDLSFVPYYASVDDVFVKNVSASYFSSKLDNYIELLNNPSYKWNCIKTLLESHNIPTYDIAHFEHYFVLSILEHKDYSNEIKKYCNSNHVVLEAIKDKLPYIFEALKKVIELYAKK